MRTAARLTLHSLHPPRASSKATNKKNSQPWSSKHPHRRAKRCCLPVLVLAHSHTTSLGPPPRHGPAWARRERLAIVAADARFVDRKGTDGWNYRCEKLFSMFFSLVLTGRPRRLLIPFDAIFLRPFPKREQKKRKAKSRRPADQEEGEAQSEKKSFSPEKKKIKNWSSLEALAKRFSLPFHLFFFLSCEDDREKTALEQATLAHTHTHKRET